jgi:hypothetical protein
MDLRMGQPTLNAWKIILVVEPSVRRYGERSPTASGLYGNFPIQRETRVAGRPAQEPKWFPSIVIRYLHLNKIGCKKRTQGTETSKYLQERTSTETPQVVASERGPGQWQLCLKRNNLESLAVVGDSPVRVDTMIVLE